MRQQDQAVLNGNCLVFQCHFWPGQAPVAAVAMWRSERRLLEQCLCRQSAACCHWHWLSLLPDCHLLLLQVISGAAATLMPWPRAGRTALLQRVQTVAFRANPLQQRRLVLTEQRPAGYRQWQADPGPHQ